MIIARKPRVLVVRRPVIQGTPVQHFGAHSVHRLDVVPEVLALPEEGVGGSRQDVHFFFVDLDLRRRWDYVARGAEVHFRFGSLWFFND